MTGFFNVAGAAAAAVKRDLRRDLQDEARQRYGHDHHVVHGRWFQEYCEGHCVKGSYACTQEPAVPFTQLQQAKVICVLSC